MTWTETLVIWLTTGACGFAVGRWVVSRIQANNRVNKVPQAPEWLERHQRLHTHASLAAKRQTIDGSRNVVRKETLKLHLSPHFMFNALSSVQWLWGEGRIDEAKHVFPSFVQLWKDHWREEGVRTHPLGAELDTLEQYVKLEEIRLGQVVQWEVCCADRAWLNIPVPSLLMQPAVENAIWHGFGSHDGRHDIKIDVSPSAVKLNGAWLDITILDNGAGLPSSSDVANAPVTSSNSGISGCRSVGLEVTRKRLLEHHPMAKIEVRRAAMPWSTEVVFTLPFDASGLQLGQAHKLRQPG